MTSLGVRLVSAAILTLGLGACARTIESHGDLPEADRLSQIQVGRTKSDVLALLGTPSMTFNLGAERWYYVSNQTEQFAIFKTQEIERKVIVIEFNKESKISDIKMLGLQDGQDISMISRTTPTTGQGLSLIGELLGNVGRFDAGDKKGQ